MTNTPIDVHRRTSGRIVADGIQLMDDEDADALEREALRLRAIARFLRAEQHWTIWQRIHGRGKA